MKNDSSYQNLELLAANAEWVHETSAEVKS